MPPITLRPITRDNWQAALALKVLPEQQRFVSAYQPVVLVGLAKSYVGALGLSWSPFGIYCEEQIVGFLALAFRPGSEDDYWLFHFFIDHSLQGRGYGAGALHALLEHLRTSLPGCRSLALTVHPKNLTAQHLYRKFGFVNTGSEAFGEPLYRLHLS